MRSVLSLILNIIWLLTAGWALFLGYLLAGVLACILIVTIPFGLASFRIAGFVIWPFGREVVDTGRGGAMGTLGNVIWFVIAGWWLARPWAPPGPAVTIIGIRWLSEHQADPGHLLPSARGRIPICPRPDARPPAEPPR